MKRKLLIGLLMLVLGGALVCTVTSCGNGKDTTTTTVEKTEGIF